MWKRIKLSSTEEVKARRKLELAEYALRTGDYDSAV
jgi:HEPN domain-containing protein